MSLSIAIGLYHLLGLSGTAAVVWRFYRRRSWLTFLSGGVFLASYTLVLAVLLAAIPFDPLRAARLLCYGWFVHGPIYLIATSVRPQLRYLRAVSATFLCLIAAVTWFSFCVEPYRLELTQYQVHSDRVDQAFRIGVIADYQTDKLADYEKSAWRRLLQARPDVIVMPGDFLQANNREDWEALRDATNAFLHEIQFSAAQGVFAVGGNTDFRRRWPEIFADLDVTTMRDTQSVTTEHFDITGLSVEDSFATDLSVPRPSEKLHIVLGHAPDFALSPSVDADLLIAGHTHGGQVRLPLLGPLITFSQVPRSWAAGLTQIDPQRTLIVSRGVGMERRDAPRLRFLCRPQLVIVDVLPTGSKAPSRDVVLEPR